MAERDTTELESAGDPAKGTPMNLAESIRPLGDNVIVKLIEKPKVSHGGVNLPDVAALPSQEGIVIAMGPGELQCVHCGSESRKPMPTFSVGSKVLFTHWAGSEIRHDGEALFILKAGSDVIAVVEDA